MNPGLPGLLQAPTGSGKSEIMGHIARLAVSKGKRVGFVVNRRILVNDLCKRVKRLGLDFGIIMSGHPTEPWKPIQVASFDTLRRREILPKLDIVFIDECHFSLSEKYIEVIDRFRDQGTSIIGATATPVRGLGDGLGFVYKWMVRTPDVPDLIEQGFLVQPRIFAPSTPDLRGVRVTGDDYNQRQLEEACDQTKITGDILKHWKGNLQGRPTIAFGVSLQHCRHMTELFLGAGVRAEYVDHTSTGLDAVWGRLSNYETEVVFNVGLAGYGWDCPPVSGMIEARPTASLALWLQHCGRPMRRHPGKLDCIINDHAGNTKRHGFPDEYREWPLDAKAVKITADSGPSVTVSTCRKCYRTFRAGPKVCPSCGTLIPIKYRKIEEVEGDLIEIAREKKARKLEEWRNGLTEEQKVKRYREWVKTAQERGYKPQWSYVICKKIFGHPPPKHWVNA